MALAHEEVNELRGDVATGTALRGLGDVAHVIGHAREVEVRVDHELDETKVARDGLLRGNEHEGLLLEGGAAVIEPSRLRLDGLGLLPVALLKGIERLVELKVDVCIDVDELLAKLGELAIECLTHSVLLRCFGPDGRNQPKRPVM